LRVSAILAVVLVLPVAAPLATSNTLLPASAAAGPMAVIALIDTGINPYHVAFRDDSALAQQHPCTYIPGYPCDAQALPLTLNAPDYAAAYAQDKPLWDAVASGQLYWIPGTKIVGAISFGNGGVACPNQVNAADQHAEFDIPPSGTVHANALGACPPERILLDDHGHGTMTASRSAGDAHSLCPSCRIVEIEGLGSGSLRWAADQGWIDVSSNSWLSVVPAPVENLGDDPSNPGGTVGMTFAYAAQRMVTLAASGNGAGFITGVAPTPTYFLSTGAPGVFLVGGHDNGRVTAWAGAPTTVVADAYGGFAAAHDSLTRWEPDPISCCTSAAAPYAAGGAAAIVLEARALLGATGTGIHDGIIAQGPGATEGGPLSDGVFTMFEFSELFRHTAQARPVEGADDGMLHWTGALPSTDIPTDVVLRHGPGANPFCQGCWTLPVKWSDVPAGEQQFPLTGYGGINEHSAALASEVLLGETSEPVRVVEDALFAADQTLRATVFFPAP
jgi:subtilase family protein